MITDDVANAFIKGSGSFKHGQTYQDMPVPAAASIEIIKILTEKNNKVLNNGKKMGEHLLNNLKKRLSNHPYVGNIRGAGLFYGIEFVSDKESKSSFKKELNISQKIADFALKNPYNISIYPCTNTVNGYIGDCHIIAPPLTVKKKEIDLIVDRYSNAIIDYFNENNF